MLTLDSVGVLVDGSTLASGVPANPRKALSFPSGSDATLRFSLVNSAGVPVSLIGGTLTFTLKKRYTDYDALISRNGTPDLLSTGVATFRFVPSDTKNLFAGAYSYDIWFTDALGNRSAVVPTSPFMLEPAVTLAGQIGTVPFFPPAPLLVATGWLSIVDVTVVDGLASNKIWEDAPNNTILQAATISRLSLILSLKASAPRVLVGGSVLAVLSPHVSGGFYAGTVAVSVPGSGSLMAQMVTPDGALGASDTVAFTYVPAPSVLTLAFTGGYPGVQTELKAGDTFQVSGTTDVPAVAVEVQNLGAGISQTLTFSSATSFTVTITIADRGTTLQSLAATLKAKDANGALGAAVATSNTVACNNVYPTVTFGAVTYPGAQGALKAVESADVAVTLANLSSVLFDSPAGEVSIAGPTVIAASKTVTRIGGTYNVATNNLRATAQRAANGTQTIGQTVVAVANVAPTVSVVADATRLRSGGNDGTAVQGHAISVVANQLLLNAPSLTAGVGGGTFIGSFTGGPSTWVRTLNVSDNDTKGGYTFTGLVATGLAGLQQAIITSGATYVLGGFVARTLTFAPFSQSTTLNVGVVTYSKLQAGIFTATNQAAARNAAQGNHSDLLNTFTVDSLGNVGPTNLWWNDVAAAGSNSGGTAAITNVEELP